MLWQCKTCQAVCWLCCHAVERMVCHRICHLHAQVGRTALQIVPDKANNSLTTELIRAGGSLHLVDQVDSRARARAYVRMDRGCRRNVQYKCVLLSGCFLKLSLGYGKLLAIVLGCMALGPTVSRGTITWPEREVPKLYSES